MNESKDAELVKLENSTAKFDNFEHYIIIISYRLLEINLTASVVQR